MFAVLSQTGEITLNKIFNIIGANMDAGKQFLAAVQLLPDAMLNSGLYPMRESCSAIEEQQIGKNPDCYARMSLSESHMQTIKTSSGNIYVPEGVGFVGRLKLW